MLEDALLAEGCTDDNLLAGPPPYDSPFPGDEERKEGREEGIESGGTLAMTGTKENVFFGPVAIEVRDYGTASNLILLY